MNQIQIPPLAEGETYIGAIGNAAGDIHHIVLLPGDTDGASWEAKMEWAKSIGGDLPDRVEQALLFRDKPELFQKTAYWSNQKDEDGWAWFQRFSYGSQSRDHAGNALRARAVRRLPI